MGGLNRPLTVIACAAALLSAVSCGGGGAPRAAAPGFPITVEGADGREITFDRPPERIVSLSPGHTEVLFAIGAGGLVIAVDGESDFPGAAAAKSKVDPGNLQEIADLNPDLVVVMPALGRPPPSLDRGELPVLLLESPKEIGDLFEQIDLLGQITGRIEQSDALVDSMDSRVLAMLDRTAQVRGPRVYHELSEQLTTASAGTFVGELYTILNAENIAAADQEASPRLSLDAIVEADPEVIIVAKADTTPESVKARPGWRGISAVKNGRVYAVDPAIVNRPGPRLVDGLETLAKLLYPELFPPE